MNTYRRISSAILLAVIAGPTSARAQSTPEPVETRSTTAPGDKKSAPPKNKPDIDSEVMGVIHWRNTPVGIAIRMTDPATIVYTEYSGPYWGVGSVLKRVRADMEQANHRGPTFVRYPADPRGHTILPNPTRIGYLTDPGVKPHAGYVVEHGKAELTVSATVLGPNSGTTSLYPEIRHWAARQGYDVIGPIVELYYPLAPGAPPANQQTEIRMPLRPLADPVVSRDGDEASKRPDGQIPDDPLELHDQPVEKPLDPTGAPLQPTTPEAQKSDDPPTAAPTTIQQENPRSERSDGDSAGEQPGFARLIEAGEYAQALEVLIPVRYPLSDADADWLLRIADRVEAIADGLANDDAHARQAASLAAALQQAERRVVRMSAPSTTADLPSHTRVDPAERERIVQDLDRLMARISLRAADGPTCISELQAILIRVQAYLNHDISEKDH